MPTLRAAARISMILLGFLTASCTVEERTELVVVIDGAIPGLDRVHVRVRSEDRTRLDEDLRLGVQADLPLSFGLLSRAHGDALVEVFVEGFANEARVVEAEARTRFVPRQRRVLQVWLDASCGVVPGCPDRETCRGGVCVDAYVDPATLPPYRGALPDAGPAPGLDAGPPDAGPRDASADAASDGGDGGPDAATCEGDGGVVAMPPGCVLDRWPARPTCGDSGDDEVDRFVALLDPLFDQGGDRWRMLGHDLDGLCTDPFASPALAECTTSGGIAPDGDDGIDNAVGNVLSVGLLAAFPEAETDARATLLRGRQVPVVRLADWSGLPDDAHVSVWVAGTVDTLTAETTLPEPLDGQEDLPDPRFDGTDRAYLASAYFDGVSTSPLVYDDNAYVAGGVLVARLPDRAPLDLPSSARTGAGRIRLTDVRLVATLSDDGTHFDDAVLVGRWARSDMLAYLGDLGLCTSDPTAAMFIAVFTGILDRSLDVRSLAGSGGPGVPCDAVSSAIPFLRSAPVQLGGIVPFDIVGATCP